MFLDIFQYLKHISKDHPDLIEIISIGKSFNNEDLQVAKFTYGPKGEKRPAIWIDGGKFKKLFY